MSSKRHAEMRQHHSQPKRLVDGTQSQFKLLCFVKSCAFARDDTVDFLLETPLLHRVKSEEEQGPREGVGRRFVPSPVDCHDLGVNTAPAHKLWGYLTMNAG